LVVACGAIRVGESFAIPVFGWNGIFFSLFKVMFVYL